MAQWSQHEPGILAAIRKLQELTLRIEQLVQLKNAQRTLAMLRALQPPKEKHRG